MKHAFLIPAALLALGAQALAAEPSPSATPYGAKPAVDGLNGKIGAGFGGTKADGSSWDGMGGAFGVLSIPLGHSFGLQLDATAGSLSGKLAGEGAAHLFWRNPDKALVGLYASGFDTSQGDMPYLAQGAGEAYLYLGRFTFGGLVGAQKFESNYVTRLVGFDKPQFFDQIALSWYPTDNLMLSVGHAYSFKKHAVTLQAEHLVSGFGGKGAALSVFAQGFAGESKSYGAIAGVKVYFGQSDKSLIRRHREDDPPTYRQDYLSSLLTVLQAFSGSGRVRSTPTVNSQITDSVTSRRLTVWDQITDSVTQFR